MRSRKSLEALKYLAVAVIAAAATAFFFLRQPQMSAAPVKAEKQQTGYKAEDRQKLEMLIHNGGKDD